MKKTLFFNRCAEHKTDKHELNNSQIFFGGGGPLLSFVRQNYDHA